MNWRILAVSLVLIGTAAAAPSPGLIPERHIDDCRTLLANIALLTDADLEELALVDSLPLLFLQLGGKNKNKACKNLTPEQQIAINKRANERQLAAERGADSVGSSVQGTKFIDVSENYA